MGSLGLARCTALTRGAAALGAWAALHGCSGEAFRLAPVDLEGDAGAFPPMVPQSSLGDGARPDDAPSDPDPDGGADEGSPDVQEPPEPEPESPCGPLREDDPAVRDGEVCVPAGTFRMGSDAPNLGGGYVGHGPEHTVITSAYVLDAYEVTVARYRACVSAGSCPAPSTALGQGCTYTQQPDARELHPVTCVAWQQAQAFCAWDGGRRLPTEAEWERAARGPSAWSYAWGDTFDCTRAVAGGGSQCPEHAGVSPKAVGSAAAGVSPEGAYDLIGNASEWVQDWFGPYGSVTVTDPTGPTTGSTRIQRGGSWQTRSADAVAYGRRAESPAAIGAFSFRCARGVP